MLKGPDVAAEAFRRGASGYVLKHCNAEDLVVAVRRAHQGESYLSPMITKDTVEFLLHRAELTEKKSAFRAGTAKFCSSSPKERP